MTKAEGGATVAEVADPPAADGRVGGGLRHAGRAGLRPSRIGPAGSPPPPRCARHLPLTAWGWRMGGGAGGSLSSTPRSGGGGGVAQRRRRGATLEDAATTVTTATTVERRRRRDGAGTRRRLPRPAPDRIALPARHGSRRRAVSLRSPPRSGMTKGRAAGEVQRQRHPSCAGSRRDGRGMDPGDGVLRCAWTPFRDDEGEGRRRPGGAAESRRRAANANRLTRSAVPTPSRPPS
jgi:hypothetical protein